MNKVLGVGSTKPIKDELAVQLGLYEAFVLQQVHYWLTKSKHEIKGRRWVYNSYADWNEQLPFMSVTTVRRTILKLEKQGILISGCFNKHRMDKTKWYTINYETLDEMNLLTKEDVECLEQSHHHSNQVIQQPNMSYENSQPDVQDCSQGLFEKVCGTKAIPKITSKTTIENTTNIALVEEVIEYLNKKTKSHYKVNNPTTIKLINNKCREGYDLEDFKIVIDKKSSEWLDDRFWSRYLRPQTLFGPKFEMYLNQIHFRRELCEEDFNFDD